MPIYEFVCEKCAASRESIVDHKTRAGLELLCVNCGGVMRAEEVSNFSVIASAGALEKRHVHPRAAKSCGHTHACRCSIKMTQPNPFQTEIDSALGNVQVERSGDH